MTLAAGARLACYEIVAPLAAGGMGEIYRARDPRLGREVAIKLVSERLMGDPRAMTRLEVEARAVAAVSHPNIVALYDVGCERGAAFAVMELLEGEPLTRRLASERIPWRSAIEIAAAVADGLAAAHARGFVHRDIKSSNIFITHDGIVKILDFGLARKNLFESTGAGAAVPPETEPGVVLGTVGYMSPEQVKGETVDHRSDIFSLGCVLYEMLAGRPPFSAESPPETLAAIIRDTPIRLSAVAGAIPPQLDAVVCRCLQKDRERRFQSARDLAFALREIGRGPDAGGRARSVATARAAPIAAAAVIVATVLWWFGVRGPRLLEPHASIRSLAVLPVVNLSPDHGEDDFADAITEALTTRLAQLGLWRVTSHTSVIGYRGTQKKIPEIARELGVDAVVEGAVIRDGPRVKITAQLIDGQTNRHIWADSFERNPEGALAIQDDVARAIARGVNVTLTAAANHQLEAATPAVAPAAYDAYVRGRHAWEKRGEADLREAIRYFQQSIDADPTYAPAYAGMADCYAQIGYGSYISPEDAFPRARAAAQKALELDPMLAEAHASLGFTLMYYDWNFSGAEEQFKRAIELNPNYAVAHQWYAYLLTAMERPLSEAEREISSARSLDPLSVPIRTDWAYILHYYGKDKDALRSVQLALEMNPKFPLAYFWLGRIYANQGRYREAEAALGNIGPLRSWTPGMAALGYAYARAGHVADANAVLAEFDALSQRGKYASAYAIAVICAGLGDRERVFAYLDTALRERSHWLVWLERDPRWNDVRSDPRFDALVRKVGLPRHPSG